MKRTAWLMGIETGLLNAIANQGDISLLGVRNWDESVRVSNADLIFLVVKEKEEIFKLQDLLTREHWSGETHLLLDSVDLLVDLGNNEGLANMSIHVAPFNYSRILGVGATVVYEQTEVYAQRKPRIVAVFNTKGGVGKTFVAANLAIWLKQQGLNTVLFDADMTSSDIALNLDMIGTTSILDVLSRWEGDRLEPFLPKHDSGLPVLLGPPRPELSDLVGLEDLSLLLKAAKEEFPVVILDLSPEINNETTLLCLEQATDILLVSTLDMTALRQTKLAFDLLKQLEVKGADKLILVLNKVRNGQLLSPAKAQELTGIFRIVSLPYLYPEVERNLLRGIPLVLDGQAVEAKKAFMKLAHEIFPDQIQLTLESKGLDRVLSFFLKRREA